MTQVLTVYARLLITILVYSCIKFHKGILIKKVFEQYVFVCLLFQKTNTATQSDDIY